MKRVFDLVSFLVISFAALQDAQSEPNIVIILADDLGYADVGCQGCQDIPTPHIDSIANNGVRFTDGYATHPVCSPSRAGLMSGVYQHRFGFEHNSGPERYAAPNFGLPRSVPTLAEKLKAVGYATGMVGKWHIGFQEGLRPHERGFDYYYGFLSGARSYYPDNPREQDPLIRNGVRVTDERAYLTDAFAREAVDFIDHSKEGPFFLYVAFNAVHSPLEATEAYEGRFPDIADPKRRTYAGMTAAMDDAVGRVLAKLREHNLEENTLICFYSDNGGPTQQTTSRNNPLRGYKGQMWEGGIRVPFLMQWKGKLPAGAVYREMVMGFDVHATALAAAGIETRSVSKGSQADRRSPSLTRRVTTETNLTLDGVNLVPYLTGEKRGRPHEKLFWRAGDKHTARVGDWKLVQERGFGPQIFDLANDIGEQNDLAASNPEKLKELQTAFAEWEKGTQPAKWVRQDARNAEIGGKLKPEAERTTRRRRPAAPRIDEAFKKADKNNDGRLSRAEYPRPEIFNAVDANKDGFATPEEVRAYFRNRQGN